MPALPIDRTANASPFASKTFVSLRDTAAVNEPFLQWGRSVVQEVARLLEAEIPGARCEKRKRLPDYEAVYVHFQDAHLPQSMAIWVYATREGTRYNVPGGKDVIAVGLKHDATEELDRPVWKFRRLSGFTWRKHVDERLDEGFRWISSVADLPDDPQVAGDEIAQRVLVALRRAGAVAPSS
jgi:hypothetical protein